MQSIAALNRLNFKLVEFQGWKWKSISGVKALLALAAWNISSVLRRALLNYKKSFVNEGAMVLLEDLGWVSGGLLVCPLVIWVSFFPFSSDDQKISAAVRENDIFNLQVPCWAFYRRFCKRKSEKCEGKLLTL